MMRLAMTEYQILFVILKVNTTGPIEEELASNKEQPEHPRKKMEDQNRPPLLSPEMKEMFVASQQLLQQPLIKGTGTSFKPH